MQCILSHNHTNTKVVFSNVKKFKINHEGFIVYFDESHEQHYKKLAFKLKLMNINNSLNIFKYADNLAVRVDFNNWTLEGV